MSEAPPNAGAAPPPGEAPSRLTFPRLLFLVLVGPLLVLAWRTGSKISADREAWRLGRELSAMTPDGRPDARVMLHLLHGSSALFQVLEQKVRTGPPEERAGIARALGCSRHPAILPELVAELRDGCLDPESVVTGGRRAFPLRVLPPDELALSQETHMRSEVEALLLDTSAPFDKGWARTYLLALRSVPDFAEPAPASAPLYALGADVVALAASEDAVLRERAVRLLTWTLTAAPDAIHGSAPLVHPSARAALVALVAPRPVGRLAAAVLARFFLDAANEEVRSLSEQLLPADLVLARDPLAVAHAARALARGDATAATTLGVLATRDPDALEALVQAVAPAPEASGQPQLDPAVRDAAIAVLQSSSDPRAAEALKKAGR